jgi:hypothetical protein
MTDDADDRRRAAIGSAKTLAEHHDMFVARLVLVVRERSADQEHDAEHVEQIRRRAAFHARI